MTTARDVAQWMADEVQSDGYLPQEYAVGEIIDRFGFDFVYMNDNGNYAIARPVLREFRKLTNDTVVWEQYERRWRLREPSDPPKRQVE